MIILILQDRRESIRLQEPKQKKTYGFGACLIQTFDLSALTLNNVATSIQILFQALLRVIISWPLKGI